MTQNSMRDVLHPIFRCIARVRLQERLPAICSMALLERFHGSIQEHFLVLRITR